ncbi:hypothetical protein [Flammeovirga sp. SJP92]|uniref:hypothetical protein n=1 Tax=Flammeovirga sp. SJP92 TaxID=1775430 RepID=UPI00078943FE|nr:hypothetical protein [Flammeovirga sp. SJP92]KXX72068.1 hypothetical protein AVL50_02810 [Flammeovirga sp. SJP92]
MSKHSLCYEKIIKSDPVRSENGQMISFMDSMFLQLDINGKNVKGTFEWMPSKSKYITGTLKGKIEENLIKAIYTYQTSEGLMQQEERYIKLEEDSAYFRVGGKMRLKDGVYVYTNDQDNMQFGAAIPLKYCGL